MNWRLILGLILVLLFGVVLAQNAASVSVRFLFWGFYASMIVVILLAWCWGSSAGWPSPRRSGANVPRPEPTRAAPRRDDETAPQMAAGRFPL